VTRLLSCFILSACTLLVSVQVGHGEPPTPTEPKGPEKAEVRTDRYGDPLPEGAVARLGTLRLWHGGPISSVAFSPDSKTVVSAGGSILVWDVATGREVRRYSGHKSRLRSVDFSPDGKMLIAAHWATDAVYFWDAGTGQLVRHIGKLPSGREMRNVDPVNEVRHLALAPDGKTLATTQMGLRLWDMATGQGLGELNGEGESVHWTCVTFSPDGKALAAGDYDGHVRLWDLATKQAGVTLSGPKDSVLCLAFSPGGKALASSAKDCKVRLWDPRTGQALCQISGHEQPVRSLAFTPGGKSLVAGSPDRISLWDPATGKEVRRLTGQGGEFNSVALSPDGKLLAAGAEGGKVALWDVATGKPVLPFDGHHNWVNSLAFSPDGRTLASGGYDEARLWSLDGLKTVRRLGEDGPGVTSVAYSPDGKRLACALRESVRLWEVETGKEETRLPSPDWPVDSGKDSGPPHGPKDDTCKVVFTPDGKCVISRHQSGLSRVWDTGSGKISREFGDRCGQYESPDFCALSPDGTLMAVGGSNAKTELWAVTQGRKVRQVNEEGRSSFSGAYSPDGKTLAVADIDIYLCDVETGKQIRRLVGHRPWVFAVAFSPDGRSLASAGTDEDIRVWEVATGTVRRCFRGHQDDYFRVRCLAFSPDGKLLASGGYDTTILLWGVTRPSEKGDAQAASLSRKELTTIWDALSGNDAGRAYEGMCRLIQSPAQSVPLFKDRLSPVPHADPKRMDRLLADLDAEEFEVRETASRELGKYEEVAGPALKGFLKGNPSPEARRRADELLTKLGADLTGEKLRAVRAVEVLEHIGTPEACQVLESLAKGAPEARLTREAKGSLDRLAKRGPVKP
jgi:WD40 repeat protein